MADRIFTTVNAFARATPWLHGVLLGYATYGVALFAVLLGCGWWIARQRGSGMPSALWAPVGVLLAVAVNQPIVAVMAEPRHDMGEVEQICDDVTIMRTGQVVYHGSITALRAKAPQQAHEIVTTDDDGAALLAAALGLQVTRTDAGLAVRGPWRRR